MELFIKQLWLWCVHGSPARRGQKTTKGGVFLVWCTQLHFKHSGRFLCYPSMVLCHILMGLLDFEHFSTFLYRAFSPRRLWAVELKSAKDGTVMGGKSETAYVWLLDTFYPSETVISGR